MHTEYIVTSRQKIASAPVVQGYHFEGHFHDVQFYFSLCFLTCGHKFIWYVLNVSFIFEISVHNQLVRDPIWKETNKNYFNKIKNTPFVKKRYKKNQTSQCSAYQLSPNKTMFPDQGVCGLYVKYPYLVTLESLYILKN